MRRTLMLLKQLHEAQKFILRDDVNSKRLALILLDNFIEVQLVAKIKKRFSWDNMMCFTYKNMNMEYSEYHYSRRKQETTLKFYDELLGVAVKEGFINDNDSILLKFAHDRRNASYHSFSEEETLTKIGVYLLYTTICKYQPKWGNGIDFAIYSSADPLDNEFSFFNIDLRKLFFSWEEHWDSYFNNYFKVESLENFNAQQALSAYILDMLNETMESIEYVKEFLGDNYSFNDLICDYDFEKIKKSAIIESKLNPIERNNLIQSMYENYKQSFRKKSARQQRLPSK